MVDPNNNAISTEQVWKLLSERLRGFIRQRVSDEQIVEDILQETFVRIHKKLGEFKDKRRLTSWVFQIARNLVTDHYRAKVLGTVSIVEDLEANDDVDENLNELVAGWLPRMIEQLPKDYRHAVELYELKGVPQQAIADRLGISLSGAKSRIQRGRQKLKVLLLDCCSFERDVRGNVVGFARNRPDSDCNGTCKK